MRWMSMIVALAVCSVTCAQEKEKPAHSAASQLQLSTERVIVFKDGYGLIVKNGKATADARGKVFTPQVPESAILGSFWAMSDGQKLLAMEAGWEEKREVREKRTSAITIPELLRANVGRRITLVLSDRRTITGTLAQVLDIPAEPAATPSPSAPGFFVEMDGGRSPFEALRNMSEARAARILSYGQYGNPVFAAGEESGVLKRELTPRGGDFVVMDETESGRMVLPVNQVHALSGKDLQTQMVREEEVFSRTKRLNFDFGADLAGKEVKLTLFYFTSGLRWIPTYRVSGELKDKADLALQGEVLNDIEDIEKAALDLVVGVPNFRFKETTSPLTLERVMRNALVAAQPGFAARSNEMSNSIYSQQAGAWRGREVEGASAASMAPELAGSGGEQDLFVYSVKQFSLKKGSRATVPLWQNTVPMRHVYTLDLRPIRSRGGHGHVEPQPGVNPSPLKFAQNKIWHQLELANNSALPWTTGAALSMRQSLPLGQDLLTYTPVGGCSLLPLTVAVDMLSNTDEEEVSRKPNAINYDGTHYTLVTKKGTISLTNYRKEKSVMRISLSTGGRVENASDDGKVKMNDFIGSDWQDGGYHTVNNHSDVTWDLSIDPGQTKTLTYTVSFYTR
jgi:hypothetical protein